jgi:hypothetical protein
MKIVIARNAPQFEVRIIDERGLTTRKFNHGDLEQARRAAAALSITYGDCPIIDQAGGCKA